MKFFVPLPVSGARVAHDLTLRQLLSTFTPGQAAANLFSLKSWQETFSRQGLECDWWVGLFVGVFELEGLG